MAGCGVNLLGLPGARLWHFAAASNQVGLAIHRRHWKGTYCVAPKPNELRRRIRTKVVSSLKRKFRHIDDIFSSGFMLSVKSTPITLLRTFAILTVCYIFRHTDVNGVWWNSWPVWDKTSGAMQDISRFLQSRVSLRLIQLGPFQQNTNGWGMVRTVGMSISVFRDHVLTITLWHVCNLSSIKTFRSDPLINPTSGAECV